MGSTLSDITLSSSIIETKTVSGNSSTFGKSRTVSTSIREFAHLNRKVTGAFVPLLEFKSTTTESGVQFDADLVKYVRITNLDDTASAALAIIYGEQGNPPTGTISIKLEPRSSGVMGSPSNYCFEGEGVPTRDVQSIEARGIDGATPDIEVIVGSE